MTSLDEVELRKALASLEGVEGVREIGRNFLVVGYQARRGGRDLALEVCLPGVDEADTAAREREFFRVSALQARVAHPGFPAVLETGFVAGHPYRMREFAEGRPVGGLVAEGPLPDDRLASLARALVGALEALHRRGCIHGSLEPDGLRIDRSGRVRFLEVGRGLPFGSPLPPAGRSETLSYAAPEFQPGAPAHPAVDLYALGSILAALATGFPPAPGRAASWRPGAPRLPGGPPESLRPGMAALVGSLLDPDPARRPTARALAADLARLEELEAGLRVGQWRPTIEEGPPPGRHPYPLYGRDRELAALTDRWREAARGHGGVMLLAGEEGSGRSRLAEELRRGVELSGGCAPALESPLEEPLPSPGSDEPRLLLRRTGPEGGRGLQALAEALRGTRALALVLAPPRGEEGAPLPPATLLLELGPCSPAEAGRLAEAWLSAPAPAPLRQALMAARGVLPGDLLRALEAWAEEGRLRPHWGAWLLDVPRGEGTFALPRSAPAAASVGVASPARPAGCREEHAERLARVASLWPMTLEQYDPVGASLRALAAELGASGVWFWVRPAEEGLPLRLAMAFRPARGAGPTEAHFPRHLLERAARQGEAAWGTEPVGAPGLGEEHLAMPLRAVGRVLGVLGLAWWEGAAPADRQGSLVSLRAASAPLAAGLAFSLDPVVAPPATSSREDTLHDVAEGLAHLAAATQDPADVLQRLLEALGRIVPYDGAAARLREGEAWQSVIGLDEVDPALSEEALRRSAPVAGEGPEGGSLLAVPLQDAGGALGLVLLTRAEGSPFTKAETAAAWALARQAAAGLRNARLFGEQTNLLAVTRHRFLAAQIRPHFLFNALNTLACLVATDPERTEELILDVADFLRTTFADRPDVVPLAEELRFLETYLRLEQARFGHRLRTRIQVDPEALSYPVPALLLQPLVENSVRHGVSVRGEGGCVSVDVHRVPGGFQVEVADDGVGFDPATVRPTGTGVGLSNVRERLLGRYGESCRWQLRSAPGAGTAISFLLPLGGEA